MIGASAVGGTLGRRARATATGGGAGGGCRRLSRLMGADEVGTLAALKALRREIVDPAIAEHRGRIVKTTGDGMLVEFASAVDAVTCAMAVQGQDGERARSEHANQPSASASTSATSSSTVMISSATASMWLRGWRTSASPAASTCPGVRSSRSGPRRSSRSTTLARRSLKNIDRPVRLYAARTRRSKAQQRMASEARKPLPLPDKPSIAVLPFQNMAAIREQEYFADGMVEEIITALSRNKQLFVIARNSSFTFKGRAVDIKQGGSGIRRSICSRRQRQEVWQSRTDHGSVD